VFPVLAVIAGIAVGVLVPSLRGGAVPGLLATCVLSAFAWKTQRDRAFAVSLLIGFGCAGVLLGAAQGRGHASPLPVFEESRTRAEGGLPPVTVEGVIRQDATPTEYGASMTLDVIRVQTACGWLPASGGLRMAINGNLARDRVDTWRTGRRVHVPVLLRLPSTFRDRRRRRAFGMIRRGIALTGSAKSGSLVIFSSTPLQNSPRRLALARRAVSQAIPIVRSRRRS
jgi:hypothetical protein